MQKIYEGAGNYKTSEIHFFSVTCVSFFMSLKKSVTPVEVEDFCKSSLYQVSEKLGVAHPLVYGRFLERYQEYFPMIAERLLGEEALGSYSLVQTLDRHILGLGPDTDEDLDFVSMMPRYLQIEALIQSTGASMAYP
ncbi:hypothetical protein P3C58_08680 [Mesorhizobium sp. XAP10]|uniref:hypothetical protein n=1 Tax=unclassified Mesorhizobium TaxID=325217 RepID=UPI0023DF2541|nr:MULTISPECIES: hypothetical protein [unclassified Mesorhizobium]MDF3152050.1 hypothetical protein [Mesorhizobium sp. XAP10]MDF3244936.1 hypothetical protein [Mesorhizobium sp. XAP4]